LGIETGSAHQIDQPPFRSRRIRAIAARGRFDPVADRQEQRLDPGAVPERALIGEEMGIGRASVYRALEGAQD